MATKNIMIIGVGGRTLTYKPYSRRTGTCGGDMMLSFLKLHGMAQRSGSVITYVRYGKNVAEPIVRGRTGRRYHRI